MKKIYFIIFLCLISVTSLNAVHIVGGEMTYKFLGNDQYEVRLTIYRNCMAVVPYDDPASLGVYDDNNNLFAHILLPFLSSNVVTNPNNPCVPINVNVCYEVSTYIDTVTLPPISGLYHLVYQRCCRGTIINVLNPFSFGTTISATIQVSTMNNSATFVHNPYVYVCVNSPFMFDHSAVDADADSLAYELCYPLTGASSANGQPQPPDPPPYQPIQFQSPYSLNDLLGGSQPLLIDPITGVLTAVPNTLGRFVYAVCVKEYRNGVFINTIMREFEINVTASTVDVAENPGVDRINIYPNPTPSKATIEFYSLKEEKITFLIMDIHGRILHNEDLKSKIGKNEIISHNLDKGYYTIKLVSEKGELIDKLIVL